MCHWKLDFVLGRCRFCRMRSAQERWQKVCVSLVNMVDIETVSRKPREQNLTGAFPMNENDPCMYGKGYHGLIPEAEIRTPAYIVPDGPGGPGSELAEREENWKQWNYAKACVRCDPKYGESNWAHVTYAIMNNHYPKHVVDDVQRYLEKVPGPWKSGVPGTATQEQVQKQDKNYQFLRWNRALYIRHAVFSEQKIQWLQERGLPTSNDLPDQPGMTKPSSEQAAIGMDQPAGDVEGAA